MAVGMERRADTLRVIAGRLGLDELTTLTRQPGVNEAYRVTLHYHDGRHPDQVATLTRARYEAVLLSVKYKRFHHQPAFEYPLTTHVYHDFDLAMRRLGFDRRDDQPDIMFVGEDLWLIERSSGSFFHDIVVAPDRATGVYGWMVETVTEHLPQAVRAIQPD